MGGRAREQTFTRTRVLGIPYSSVVISKLQGGITMTLFLSDNVRARWHRPHKDTGTCRDPSPLLALPLPSPQRILTWQVWWTLLLICARVVPVLSSARHSCASSSSTSSCSRRWVSATDGAGCGVRGRGGVRGRFAPERLTTKLRYSPSIWKQAALQNSIWNTILGIFSFSAKAVEPSHTQSQIEDCSFN